VTHRFFRGNNAIAGGSGLGLSIVQRIVSDHAGTLSITSELGVGTTVRIILPSAGVDREAAHTDC
jgi:signal transduction histidine kinase